MNRRLPLLVISASIIFGCGKSASTPEETKQQPSITTSVEVNSEIPKGQYIGVKIKRNTTPSTLDRFDYEILKNGVSVFKAYNQELDSMTVGTKSQSFTVDNYVVKANFRSGEKSANSEKNFKLVTADWGIGLLNNSKAVIEASEEINNTQKLNTLVGNYTPDFKTSPDETLRYVNTYDSDYFTYFFLSKKLIGGSGYISFPYLINGQSLSYSIFKNLVSNLETKYGKGSLNLNWTLNDADRQKYYSDENNYGNAIINRHLTCEWELKNPKIQVNASTKLSVANKVTFVTLFKGANF